MGPGREGSEVVGRAARVDDRSHLPRGMRAYAALSTYLDGLERYTSSDPRVALGAALEGGSGPVQIIDLRVQNARSAYRSLVRHEPTPGDIIDLGL